MDGVRLPLEMILNLIWRNVHLGFFLQSAFFHSPIFFLVFSAFIWNTFKNKNIKKRLNLLHLLYIFTDMIQYIALFQTAFFHWRPPAAQIQS